MNNNTENKKFVAKTDEITEKEKAKNMDKLADRLYHVSDMTNLMIEVLTDYVEQVSMMKDEDLAYDRSKWMLEFGVEKEEYDRYDGHDADIHTIAILLEQMRRFGKIYYDVNNDTIRFD